MYVIGLFWKIDRHSTASNKWHWSQAAVENRMSNDYMSSEGFTDADSDEWMIVDAATPHTLYICNYYFVRISDYFWKK